MPAFQKGHPKFGGRKPGSRNKLTLIEIEAARARVDMNMTPVDYLLSVMRDPTAPVDRRDRAAAAVAPYVHPRLANVEAKVDVRTEVATEAERRQRARQAILEAFGERPLPTDGMVIEHEPIKSDSGTGS